MNELTIIIWILVGIIAYFVFKSFWLMYITWRGAKVKLTRPVRGFPKGTVLYITEKIPGIGYGASTKPRGLTECVINHEHFKII